MAPEMSNPPIWALLRGLAGIVERIIGRLGVLVKEKKQCLKCQWAHPDAAPEQGRKTQPPFPPSHALGASGRGGSIFARYPGRRPACAALRRALPWAIFRCPLGGRRVPRSVLENWILGAVVGCVQCQAKE